jgi:RNA polymerase sigma factor (TIGR02999 family)
MDEHHEITRILGEWKNGRAEALEELIPIVHDELHRQADRYLRRERPNHTLQATALINEAYLKLLDQHVDWENRTHFFAIAARLMRRVLVDHARARHREKRGGHAAPVSIEGVGDIADKEKNIDLMALDEALDRLAAIDDRQARIVELRYFSGLTLEETAEILNIGRTTVADEWSVAKAWLRRELTR